MRIGIDISQIVYEGTGVAQYTRNLVKSLLQIDKKNNYILFGASLRQKFLLDKFAQELKKENLKFTVVFLRLPPEFLNTVWNQIHHVKVERLIGKIDVFHSSDWTQAPTSAKKVTTIHDLVIYKSPESSHPKIITTHKKRLEWVKKECDLIICDSQATKDDVREILKIDSRKLRVIYLAASDNYLEWSKKSPPVQKQETERVEKKYQLTKKYFLAVGTRQPRKNLDRLVEAFSQLISPDCELVIAGKFGWGETQKNQNRSRVKLLGYVPDSDLPALFAGAQAFVYPSLYEGFGVPILEAFACDCPVITSKVSSLPEVAGDAALYLEPTSVTSITKSLEKILTIDKHNRKAMIDRGRKQLEKFSWQKTARETLKAYEELAAK